MAASGEASLVESTVADNSPEKMSITEDSPERLADDPNALDACTGNASAVDNSPDRPITSLAEVRSSPGEGTKSCSSPSSSQPLLVPSIQTAVPSSHTPVTSR
jgi:hypothetical protein